MPSAAKIVCQRTKPIRRIDLGMREDGEEEALGREHMRIGRLPGREESDAESGLSQGRGQSTSGFWIHPGQSVAEHRDVPEAAAVDNQLLGRGSDTRSPLRLSKQNRRVQRHGEQSQNGHQHPNGLHRPLLSGAAIVKSLLTPYGQNNLCRVR